MNYKLKLMYDGTCYAGWQRQNNAVTIQGELEKALSVILREPVSLVGISRTDAGVHAFDFTANFHTDQDLDCYRVCRGVNALLPKDIRLRSIEPCSETFNARFNPLTKTYRYHMDLSKHSNPFYCRYAWHLPYDLDINSMKQAASFFLGEHDFSAFMAQGGSAKTFVRTLTESHLFSENGLLIYQITGNGFLYNMVRIITGTLVAVGKGKIDADAIPEILKSKDRTLAGMTAPPHGLMLYSANYPEDLNKTLT